MNEEIRQARRNTTLVILRALARFFIRDGQTFRDFVELAKISFIEVAKEDLENEGKKVNVSRISVYTGIDRESTKRIMAEEDPIPDIAPNLCSQVIGQWEQDPQFCTRNGRPRVLSLAGPDSDFRNLVRQVNTSINPGTVLFELERIEAVERTSRGGLKLVQQVQQYASEDPAGILNLLGRNVESLLSAADENTQLTPVQRHLHLRTEYTNVFIDDLPKIRKWMLKKGAEFHKQARNLISQYDQDLQPDKNKKAGAKVVLSAFSLTEAPKNSD